MVEWPQKYDTL